MRGKGETFIFVPMDPCLLGHGKDVVTKESSRSLKKIEVYWFPTG